MKKVISMLLVFAMVFAFAACGKSGEPIPAAAPEAGLYKASSAEMSGYELNVEEVIGDFSLNLLDGGKAVFHYAGHDYDMKWSCEEGAFHAEGGGAELNGTIADGVMVLEDILGSGINITLICEELLPADAEADEAAEGEEAEDAEGPKDEKAEDAEEADAKEDEAKGEGKPEPKDGEDKKSDEKKDEDKKDEDKSSDDKKPEFEGPNPENSPAPEAPAEGSSVIGAPSDGNSNNQGSGSNSNPAPSPEQPDGNTELPLIPSNGKNN